MINARLRPRLVDRYVLTEILTPLFGGVLFFTFIFLMFQLLRLAEFFIVHGVPLLQLLHVSALMCLSFLPFALPISYLISLLLGFGRLSMDSELIALKASGISLNRLIVSPLILAAALAGFSLHLNLDWVPRAERALKERLTAIGSTRLISSIQEGTFNRGFFDLLVYADRVDPNSNRMAGVFIYDERHPSSPLTVVARTGKWNTRVEPNGGTTATLQLKDGNIHRSNSREGSYQKIDFEEYRLFLKTDPGQKSAQQKPKMLTFPELRRGIETSQNNPRQQRILQGELWRRIAVALAPLAFVLLGVGAGIQPTRSVKSGATLVALLVLLLYYSFLGAGSSLAESGRLPAPFALQLGNLAILSWGWTAFTRSRR